MMLPPVPVQVSPYRGRPEFRCVDQAEWLRTAHAPVMGWCHMLVTLSGITAGEPDVVREIDHENRATSAADEGW
ncbi:hypothetical protein Pmi06nite_81590 [Planotetraspora mira]|uniref:Uncharacterized protein n=1 Tax=Planotetraspora mira TaxID=58121 RepID=A0A8J3XB64_9ACTN|nr:hypothetical protein Pmi06nite_81590 [Planotetraspora mira]